MNVPSPELIELCGAVRDGDATPEQIARLEAVLSARAEARRFYLRFMQVGALLERYEGSLREPLPASETPAVPVRRISRRLRQALALAAGLAVLTALHFTFRPGAAGIERTVAASRAVATVQDVHDAVVISAGGAPVALAGGHRLDAGEVIATGHNGSAVIRLADEETIFILGADTRAWLAFDASAKVVQLAFGQIACDVAKQRDGRSWRIFTTDGEATVLGTRLAVSVGGSGTRVAVTSGLVRVTSRESRESVETPAGYATELTPTTAIRTKLPFAAPTSLVSLTLIDAGTNNAIPGFECLTDGVVLDLATLPTRRINIRANCLPVLVGAVRFKLTGVDAAGSPLSLVLPVTNGFPNAVEAMYPYLLAGDMSIEGHPLPGHSNPWTPAVGRYTLVATPYAGNKHSGARGEPMTVRFEVVDGAARP